MTTRRRRLLIMLVAFVGLLGCCASWYLANWYRQERLDFCSNCGSRRHVEFHRLVSETGPRTPFTTDYERIVESRVCKDFMQPGHQHDWVMSWLEVDAIGGVRATGWGSNTGIRASYERDAGFRSFLAGKAESGAVPREKLKSILSRAAPKLRYGVFEPEPEDLVAAEQDLVREYAATGKERNAVDWLDAASDRQPPPR